MLLNIKTYTSIRLRHTHVLKVSSLCIDFHRRCIYEYDKEHPIGGKGFKEHDTPNFTGSFYSDTKGMVEKVSLDYDGSRFIIGMAKKYDGEADSTFVFTRTLYLLYLFLLLITVQRILCTVFSSTCTPCTVGPMIRLVVRSLPYVALPYAALPCRCPDAHVLLQRVHSASPNADI